MRTFFDASAFAKRYIQEVGSQEVDAICRKTSVLALSVLCLPEIISALSRQVREKRLATRDYQIAKNRLSEDVADALIINLIPEVIARSTVLMETNTLRAMDALHVACALEWGADLFVSSDERQIRAARKAGLRTRLIRSI